MAKKTVAKVSKIVPRPVAKQATPIVAAAKPKTGKAVPPAAVPKKGQRPFGGTM